VRRWGFRLGVLAGVLMLAAGITLAVEGYAATGGPDGAVRGYFAAISASDAAGALAYGDLPAGSRSLLTDDVLREQQTNAHLRDLRIGTTGQQGDRAEVDVTYTLAFPWTNIAVAAAVHLHERGDTWRLDEAAIPVTLNSFAARERMSILGTELPTERLLLFPGALPISLDTPYLRLNAYFDNVTFGAPDTLNVRLDLTDQARTAFERATLAAVRRCVTGAADPACPLPDERYVPGSIHGRIDGGLRATDASLDDLDVAGLLRLKAHVLVVGSYRRLTFHNVQVSGHGRLDLDVEVAAYAVPPLRLRWVSP
jgi:hypothetical protein